MRIGLFGEFGIRNFGNEASLRVMLEVLGRHPHREIVVVCDSPARVSTDHGVRATSIYHPRAARRGLVGRVLGKVRDAAWTFRSVRGVDVMVVPGTGIFEALWIRPGGISLSLFWMALAARVLRRPLLVVSVGVDPFGDRLGRFLVASTLRSARYLSVRDEHSRAAAEALVGGSRPVVLTPDIVFGAEAVARDSRPESGQRVAVGVMDFFGMPGDREAGATERRAYIDEVADLIVRLGAASLSVTLIAGAAPDRALAADVLERIGPLAGRVDLDVPQLESHEDVERAIASADVVVAPRFHNLVAAFRLGIPAVSLGYGAKQEQLMERFGMGGYHHPIADFRAAAVMAQVESVLRDRARWAELIAATLGELRADLAAQEQVLDELLDETERRVRAR